MTIKNAYPLTRIDEIFTALHNAYYFVALDLLRGYHETPVCEEDRPETASMTQNSIYPFNPKSFRLGTGPATFHRLMDGIFRDQIGKDLAAYLDDLLMYALRLSEMKPILDRTLGPVFDAGLKCKPKKCLVFPDSNDYLGQIGQDWKIGADRSKLAKFANGPFPKQAMRWLQYSAYETITDA